MPREGGSPKGPGCPGPCVAAALAPPRAPAQMLRFILASFMAVAQALRIVSIALKVGQTYESRVFSGQEPPLRSSSERIIRLCGRRSDTTLLALSRSVCAGAPPSGGFGGGGGERVDQWTSGTAPRRVRSSGAVPR